MTDDFDDFDDFVRAPNIATSPDVYQLENEALARDGRLDLALERIAPSGGRVVVDIGAGTGFWLQRLWPAAAQVIGVEPDPDLRAGADDTASRTLRAGSAEHLPLDDDSVDVAHARFAYFFGPGAEAGLAEVRRVLRPGGVLVAVDNSWRGGHFVELLRDATTGNAALDPDLTDAWWHERGATRHEVEGGWLARSPAELRRILSIEFAAEVVDRFVARYPELSHLQVRFAVFELRVPTGAE